jgi:hypothetical protein
MHKEFIEKGNTSSTSTCCNCRLAKEKNLIPPIIGAADTLRRRCRKGSRKRYPGRQPHHSGMIYAAALGGRREEQQPQSHQVALTGPATMKPRVSQTLPLHEQQSTGQSVRAPNVNSLYLNKMLKVVVTAVQQIMEAFNGALLEEAKIVAITKIVLNLMEQNGH